MADGLLIGAAIPRLEDERFLRGRGRFTDDLVPAGTLSAFFLRSPHAHARIVAIDKSRASAMPGVVAVYTSVDTADLGHLPTVTEIHDSAGQRHREPPRLPIPSQGVRHVGEILAMIVAETVEQARDAAEAIEVELESLPAVVTAADALAATAPQIHEDVPGNLMCDWHAGDMAAVTEAFARAHRVVRVQQRFNRIVANYLETRTLFAEHDAGAGVTTLTIASQGVQILHQFLTRDVLRWEPGSLRVVTADVGGGFGPKFCLYPETALVPWAARKLGRSVRWACDRGESFLTDNHARDLTAEIALAVDADGRFLALRVEGTLSYGAYVSMFAPTVPTTGLAKVISGFYRIPAIAVRLRCAFTNTVPVDAFRGAGKPEAIALLERVVDVASGELGVDPLELRRRNFVRPEDFPYTTPLGYTYERSDLDALMAEGLRLADHEGLEERRARSRAQGRLRGFGISCHLHRSSSLPGERAVISIRGDGTVEALTGTQSQGQGHETVYAQIVASVLGLPLASIQVLQGDSARIPSGGGTGGSSSLIVSGATLERASRTVVRAAQDLAAEILETAPADLVFRDGRYEVAGTDRSIGLAEVARFSEEMGAALIASQDQVDSADSWPMGVMTCEVEIDPETGVVRVERLETAVDIGVVVNPLLSHGQIHGGIAAGLGQALLEDAVYDDGSGQLLAGSWMDYAMARADDVPFMGIRTITVPTANNGLGSKGLGELPTNGAPAAVANAVLDALRPYGIRHLPTPMTPERIWRAISGEPTSGR